MTLISEIVSIDIIPFVGFEKIKMLHISHDTRNIFGWRMRVEWSEQEARKFSCLIIPWYFQNIVGFAAVLHYSKQVCVQNP